MGVSISIFRVIWNGLITMSQSLSMTLPSKVAIVCLELYVTSREHYARDTLRMLQCSMISVFGFTAEWLEIFTATKTSENCLWKSYRLRVKEALLAAYNYNECDHNHSLIYTQSRMYHQYNYPHYTIYNNYMHRHIFDWGIHIYGRCLMYGRCALIWL